MRRGRPLDIFIIAFPPWPQNLEPLPPYPESILNDTPSSDRNTPLNSFYKTVDMWRPRRFHHVRVARTSLLAGVAEVSPEGRYSLTPGGQKQAYGAMLSVRANLVMRASTSLARALTSK